MGVLELALIALVISIIAGALGFTGVARGFGKIAKILFFVFLVIAAFFLLLFILGVSIVL